MGVDHGADVAGFEPRIGNVLCENHHIVFVVAHVRELAPTGS